MLAKQEIADILFRMPRISADTVPEHRKNQRKLLLAAAKSILEKSGAEAVNFGTVADKAGLARPSVYEYFKSKSDLFLALAEDQFPKWKKQVEASILKARTPETRFEAFFSSQVRMLETGKHAVAFKLLTALDDNGRARVHEMHISLLELTKGPMQELGFKPSPEVLQLISSVLHSTIAMAGQSKSGHRKLAKTATRFVLGGMKALLQL